MRQLYRTRVSIYKGRKEGKEKFEFETVPFEITNETDLNYILFGGKKRVKKENLLQIESVVINSNTHLSYKVWSHEEDIPKAKELLENRIKKVIQSNYEDIVALKKVLEQTVPTHLHYQSEIKHDEIIFTLQEGE